MNERTLVCIRLITNKLSPEEIEAQVGLQADSHWRRGDIRVPGGTARHEDSGIELRPNVADASAESQLASLLERVRTSADKLAQASDIDVLIAFVFYCSAPPVLGIGAQAIRELAHIGARVDIDLYIVDDDRPTELETVER